MYKTFNMGMGFIIVCDPEDAMYIAGMTGGKIVGKIVKSGIRVKDLVIDE